MARQARGPPLAERENSDRGLVSAPTSAPLRTQPPPRPTGGSSKGRQRHKGEPKSGQSCDRRPQWHDCGMTRTRLSTTVDDDLLHAARRVRSGNTDAAMIDEA